MTAGDEGPKRGEIDRTSVFLGLAVGLPFATFKLLFGVLAHRHGLLVPAVLLMVWGGADAFMNGLRVVWGGMGKPPRTEFCVLAQAGRLFGVSSLLLAVDTLLAFSIICVVLWSGWIARLTAWETAAWLSATTVNLLGVALMQIASELRRRRKRP